MKSFALFYLGRYQFTLSAESRGHAKCYYIKHITGSLCQNIAWEDVTVRDLTGMPLQNAIAAEAFGL